MDAISSRVQLILFFSASSSSTSLSPSCLFSFFLALCSTLHIVKVAVSIKRSTNFADATVIIGAIDLWQLAVCLSGKTRKSLLLRHVQFSVKLQLTVRRALLAVERQFCYISSFPCGH
jgi:hypothetical protein